ncbi:histidine phosphatase family protein [Palleronia sp. LCG004]|uniref:histidine phosphatase family protein n=1 Tax=Palleronia sp. LCG004 TaxID=3079304 RepID=UPI00294232AB|nr:histidine phosphatase family protein [Palleronia sp. LCG004]WOI57464.1 histidine phosphatase family protein [Palleronia sp. LCG004]
MKRLLLIRHGETEWNADRRLQGQRDIGLSTTGEAQALALAPLVASLAPGLVRSSDLVRARRTAALLGHPGAKTEPRLREQALGDWEGRQIAEIRAEDRQAYLDWRAGSYAPPGGETWTSFRQRVQAGLEAAFATGPETVALVCHGGVIRAALDACLGLSPKQIIPVGPASLTILALSETGIRLEAFNLRGGGVTLNAPD